MSTTNPRSLGPNPGFAEKSAVTVDEILAANPRRRGPSQASEQIALRDPAIAPNFIHGADWRTASPAVERVVAGQASGRSPIGSGASANPVWLPVSDRERAAFAGAVDYGEAGDAAPFPFAPRAGANPNTLSPLDGLARGERQGTTYGKGYAPEGGGRGRRNPAELDEAL
jgi:hypothetical protein